MSQARRKLVACVKVTSCKSAFRNIVDQQKDWPYLEQEKLHLSKMSNLGKQFTLGKRIVLEKMSHTQIEEGDILGKMGHTCKNQSHLEKQKRVTSIKMGYTLKNESHLQKWGTLGNKRSRLHSHGLHATSSFNVLPGLQYSLF